MLSSLRMTAVAPGARYRGSMNSEVTQSSADHRVGRVALSGAVILLIVAVGLIIRDFPAWTTVELSILNGIGVIHSAPATALALAINWLFDPLQAAALVIVIALVMFAVTRRPRMPVVFLVLVAVPWVGGELMKLVVRRVRPDGLLLAHQLVPTPHSLSYPSGHTVFATVLCLALLLTVGVGRWRPLFIVIAIVVPLATAFSRMYLGVHYLTDVLAGLLYSVAAVTIVYLTLGRYLDRVLGGGGRETGGTGTTTIEGADERPDVTA
jgi:membrane-associated phospholipid phosphatase